MGFPLVPKSVTLNNNDNNTKICNVHNVSAWLNLRLRQSLSGEDGRSKIWKLF